MNKSSLFKIFVPLYFVTTRAASMPMVEREPQEVVEDGSKLALHEINGTEAIIANGTLPDVALDDITYHIKSKITQRGITMSLEDLEKILDQAENFVEQASKGPRNNQRIEDENIQKIKKSFDQYLEKKYP